MIPAWRYWTVLFVVWYGAWISASLFIRLPHTYWWLIPGFTTGFLFSALLSKYQKRKRP